MLKLLLTTATFVVAYAANECPAPYELVAKGAVGTGPYGGTKYELTLDGCKAKCDGIQGFYTWNRCLAFSFNPIGHLARSECRLYTYRFSHAYLRSNDHQILCAIAADVECPSYSKQVGEEGAFGDGYMGIMTTYQNAAAVCERQCRLRSGCKAFGYDPHGLNYAYCRFYRLDTERDMSKHNIRDGHAMHDQLLCKLGAPPPPMPEPECPEGTQQIGGAGKTMSTTSQTIFSLTIDQCNERCNQKTDKWECIAFEYDREINDGRSRCKLLIANYYVVSTGINKDRILCGVESFRDEPEAQSPGSFVFDELSGEVGVSGVSVVGGNGQVLGVSVNIIYIIAGLLCLNIVCLTVNLYCWRNMKKDKRKYKVVSMRSDYETENGA